MTFINKFKQIFHAALTGATTVVLVASGANTAQAAIFTYDYIGVVTELYGGGWLLPPGSNLRGVEVGDTVSGSYSYDDQLLVPNQRNSAVLIDFTYRLQASDGNTYVETLNNFLGVPVNGIVDLNTGNITVGVNSSVPLFGGISSNQGNLFYGVRNTAIVSTFQSVIVSTTQSVPEYCPTWALLAMALAPIFLQYRRPT
ncbi:hypothetical protein [Anabaena subtropica]|uniref:PEP-CTERM sorting domain-containing protein n=1 Tax=Anabaena subtropica FACHB-260 TaxID=2692884 RepID=A0ABR8CV71_9NOST|nr:hypothetical protein [Anabaena subtropica]MBD2346423.1 hypothetical protein [Anabaena subtropica FACHB-260]